MDNFTVIAKGEEEINMAAMVKEWRQEQGMTPQAFAEALGVSFQAVSRWEKGRIEPDTSFLLMCMTSYFDWRMEFAWACLRAKLPLNWIGGVDEMLEELVN